MFSLLYVCTYNSSEDNAKYNFELSICYRSEYLFKFEFRASVRDYFVVEIDEETTNLTHFGLQLQTNI